MARVRLEPSTAIRRTFFPLIGQQSVIEFRSGGQAGTSLHNALHGNVQGLEEGNDPVFANFGPKIEYVIQLFLERYQEQKHVQRRNRTITRAEAAKQVAQVVLKAMQGKGRITSESHDRLRGWYLVQLIRIGKATFACVLEYDASIVVPPATVGDSSTSLSYGSTGFANAAVPSEPSREVPTVSSSTGTDFPPMNGSPRARSDADALAHWQTQPTPPEGPWSHADFADRRLPHSRRATADNAVWPDTLSSFMSFSAATEQSTFAGNTGQYNAQPVPSITAYDTSSTLLPTGLLGQAIFGGAITNYTAEPAPFTTEDTTSLAALHLHAQMANESFSLTTPPASQSAVPPIDFGTIQPLHSPSPFSYPGDHQGTGMDPAIMFPSTATQTSYDAYPADWEMQSLEPLQSVSHPLAPAFEDDVEQGLSSQPTVQGEWAGWTRFDYPHPSWPIPEYTWGENDEGEAELVAYTPGEFLDGTSQFSLGNIAG